MSGDLHLACQDAIQRGWMETPAIPALYVCGGDDTRPITFTHGDFLSQQAGKPLESPRFFVYVHPRASLDDPLSFEDDRTDIQTVERESRTVNGSPAELLSVRFRSATLSERHVAVLRVCAEPEEFVEATEAESWTPAVFIGVEDGCGAFGPNRGLCFNRLVEPASSIPLRLGAIWWISDHFPESTASGGGDPQNQDIIQSQDEDFPVQLKQVAFLSTKWRSLVSDEVRLHGGARLFEIVRPKPWDVRYSVRYQTLYGPNVNRALR